MVNPVNPVTVGGNEDEELLATYAGARRRIAALEQQLQAFSEVGNKRKSDIATGITQGRVLCRLVSMFDSVDALVDESDRRRTLAMDMEDVEETLDQCRTFQGYKLLIQNIPNLEEKLLKMEVDELVVYFRELRKGASGARGDDTANLKPAIASWVLSLFAQPLVLLSPTSKSERGFEHDITGRLLCPIEYNWLDEGVRQKIRDGHPDYGVTADSWPGFLYPDGAGDVNDVEKGMFKSAILIKTFKFIFTSPTSAQNINNDKDITDEAPRPLKRLKHTRAPTRGHVAHLLGMKTVTPRAIAYVAVQLRFSLSNASAWNENDGCFSYSMFYNNIVDYFEVSVGPAAQARTRELLLWWTRKVFGSHTLRTSSLNRPGSSVSKLASQRAARELAHVTSSS